MVLPRKYHRGRLVREIRVFGLYDVTTKKEVIQIIYDRTRNTLLPLIERYVVPGSIIHSDQWASYMGGAITAIPVIPPYIHNSVNHHHNFCPQDGTRTNDVECFWKNMKMKFKAMSGTKRALLAGYLDEFLWRQYNGNKTLTVFDNLLEQISQYYIVNTD